MTISVATLNVNGLRNDKKRYNLFYWLIQSNYDVICIQETHCTSSDDVYWTSQWKNMGGSECHWNHGTSESRGVAILSTNKFQYDIKDINKDNVGRYKAGNIN